MENSSFNLNSKVRVRGHTGHAKIVEFYDDIEGGVRLDQQIGGFFSWNVDDLVLIESEVVIARKRTPSSKERLIGYSDHKKALAEASAE